LGNVMPAICFPVRIDKNGGGLKRCSSTCQDEGGIIHLLDVMVRTGCSGGWPGVTHFGLRDFFTRMRTGSGLQTGIVQTANRALEDLGIEWFRIESIVKDRELPNGAEYTVTVSWVGKGTQTLERVSLGSK
jgi:hypothetical protein